MQGRKNYQEQLFISFRLSDYVPADNFYRALNDILDFNFLYQSTKTYYGNEGQKSIDPVVFMKLMLVGYLENINSDRKIINTCKMRMDILFFLGYDINEELPWHSTLSRTRRLFGEEHFSNIFRIVLKQCIDKGMLTGKRQAVDSALIKANASMDTLIEKQILEDAATYTAELEVNSEQPKAIPLNTPLTELTQAKQRNRSNSYRKGNKRSNQTHCSISDSDARISYKPGKPFKMYYLCQVSVDTSSYLITNIAAMHADKGDAKCFPQVLEHTVGNLKENGLNVEEILADTGYSSSENFERLQKYQIKGYFSVPQRPQSQVSKDFVYDQANDRYICPKGKFMPLKRSSIIDHNKVLIYRASSNDCSNCPIQSACCNSTGTKQIHKGAASEHYEQMRQRMESPIGRKMKGLRSATVEPVIGTLTNYGGMRQINAKGINQANKCMLMAAAAYNLKKLLRFRTKTSLTDASTAIKSRFINQINFFNCLLQLISYKMSMNKILKS